MKTCTKCGQTKPLEAFSRRASSSDGRAYQCRECVKAYRAANRERDAARQATYRAANREKIAERDAAYRRANREAIRARYAAYYEETVRARYAAAAERYSTEGAFPIPVEVLAHRVGYDGAHHRVRRCYGPARSHPCAALGCDRPAEAWALVNPVSEYVHTEWVKDARNPDRPLRRMSYSANPADYRPLCHGCHIRLDVHGQNIIKGVTA